MSLRIKPIKAFSGDAILVSFKGKGGNRNILIDGGTGSTYERYPKLLKTEIEEIKEIFFRLSRFSHTNFFQGIFYGK